jgi:hypothetical protein
MPVPRKLKTSNPESLESDLITWLEPSQIQEPANTDLDPLDWAHLSCKTNDEAFFLQLSLQCYKPYMNQK